ncbi:MAG: helix-turn-helix domain-containing protein [Crenarchaeota archaeon]|nr:helix-turn-helix domain-containing protein [Thermoproteota archaeon]
MADIEKLPALIGRRVSELRKQRGLSLSELARLAGISKSTLSELESGKINPTVSTLWSIARALGVGFGELVEPLRELCGEDVCVQLLKKDQNAEVYLMQIRRGVTYVSSPHPEDTTEHVIVLRGVLLCGTTNRQKIVKPGETVKFVADKTHIYASFDEDVTCIVVVKYAHTFAKPNTILEIESDEPAQIREIVGKLERNARTGLDSYHILIKCSSKTLHDLLEHTLKMSRIGIKIVHVYRETSRYSIFLFNRTQLRDLSWIVSNIENSPKKIRDLIKLILKVSEHHEHVRDLIKLVEDGENMLHSLLISEYLTFINVPVIPRSVISFYMSLVGFLNNSVDIMLRPLMSLLNPGSARQVLLILSHLSSLREGRDCADMLFVDMGYGYPVKMILEIFPDSDLRNVEITYVCVDDVLTGFVRSYLKNLPNVTVIGMKNFSENFNNEKFSIVVLFNTSRIVGLPDMINRFGISVREGGRLIVAEEVIPEFSDWLSRVRILLLHYLTYILDTIVNVDVSSLSESEIELVHKSKMCCVDTLHEVLSKRVTRGLSLFLRYYNDIARLICKICVHSLSSMLLLYNIVHYFRFKSLRATLNADEKIPSMCDIFSTITGSGFAPYLSCRVYPAYGGGGNCVLMFRKV